MSRKEIADRIRQLIEKSGLTQAQIAERSGLTPAAVSHFVTGLRTPGTSSLRKLADALNTSAEYILGLDKVPTPTGPLAGAIFRNAQKLSNESLDLLKDFSDTLVQREERKKQREQTDDRTEEP